MSTGYSYEQCLEITDNLNKKAGITCDSKSKVPMVYILMAAVIVLTFSIIYKYRERFGLMLDIDPVSGEILETPKLNKKKYVMMSIIASCVLNTGLYFGYTKYHESH